MYEMFFKNYYLVYYTIFKIAFTSGIFAKG